MKAPYIEQITKMITTFGDLGLILKREVRVEGIPAVVYVETLAEEQKKLLGAEALDAEAIDAKTPTVTEEFAQARFGGLRRR
jgi:hypothetical protein